MVICLAVDYIKVTEDKERPTFLQISEGWKSETAMAYKNKTQKYLGKQESKIGYAQDSIQGHPD